MLISDLQKKDIINTKDGTKLGRIVDIDITEEGNINHLIVEPHKIFRRFSFGNETNITINQIQTIGNDVILVDYK